ncbi:MAG: ribosome maturation factor RimM [Roseburia sp.]|nr:ribosome maturation factor RimM [Roseburia sp.]
MITIGKISKPQGVRGEVKVNPLTDDPSRFCVLKVMRVGNRDLRVENVRTVGGGVFVKFVGYDDRNAAETLRGELISIDRAAAVPLSDGEFFVADIVGSQLVAASADGSDNIGTITGVDSYGAADVFSVGCADGKGMTFAFVKALCPRFDENKKTLTVDRDRLAEVAVYED